LLGRDHVRYGLYVCSTLAGGNTACTISVGAESDSPSLWSKGGDDSLNEDALFAVDDGRRLYMGVADAHFGYESSHYLIERLLCEPERIPTELAELEQRLRELGPSTEARRSESTLLLTVYDRQARQGFGISVGDSSLAIVGAQGARIVNVHDPTFLAPAEPSGIDLERSTPFLYFAPAEHLLLAFSDGIDECHYRSPATSIRERHLHTLFLETGAAPEPYARRLTELALSGVDGNPGGQDNIVLAVTRT
jgi:hypothetical protein